MKKSILLGIFLCLCLVFPKETLAANECGRIWVDPASSAPPGTIFTFRASECPISNVGYTVQLLNGGEILATLEMQALNEDKSQYSATIPQTASLGSGRYALLMVDKETGAPIQGTTIVIDSDTIITEIECNIASFNQDRILQTCIGGFASAADLRATNVTIKCNEVQPGNLCFSPRIIPLSGLNPIPRENGGFFACFNSDGPIDPIVTNISLEFNQGPNQICTINNLNVAAGTPDYICHPNNNFEENGVKTAIGCVPIDNSDDIIAFFVRWTMGIIGGVALILIIIGSYQIITSQGDKYKLQSGRDILLAALSGLLLAIFAIFLIQILGQNILQLF